MSTLTAQRICFLARTIAKGPGYAVESGEFLNSILEELAQNYDFDVIKSVYYFNFNDAGYTGSGPYPLPANWYRGIDEDIFYTINGVPYPMINIELKEFDNLVQQSGITSYPNAYATDMSQSPPVMYVWPPSSGSYPVTARYFTRPATIATPETSSEIPWFPASNYLIRRLAGEMMALTNDDRMALYLGDTDPDKDTAGSAASLLRSYLKMKDDRGGKVHKVTLDRRNFGKGFARLPNTKTIGW